MSNQPNQQLSTFLMVGIVAGLIVIGYAVKTMHHMAGYMSEMNHHVADMATDIGKMRGTFTIMTAEVSKIDDVVARMDENINAMHADIDIIQGSISNDMASISKNLELVTMRMGNIDYSLTSMTAEVSQISTLMHPMAVDIHRGTNSFSSPMNYMRNMMR